MRAETLMVVVSGEGCCADTAMAERRVAARSEWESKGLLLRTGCGVSAEDCIRWAGWSARKPLLESKYSDEVSLLWICPGSSS